MWSQSPNVTPCRRSNTSPAAIWSANSPSGRLLKNAKSAPDRWGTAIVPPRPRPDTVIDPTPTDTMGPTTSPSMVA